MPRSLLAVLGLAIAVAALLLFGEPGPPGPPAPSSPTERPELAGSPAPSVTSSSTARESGEPRTPAAATAPQQLPVFVHGSVAGRGGQPLVDAIVRCEDGGIARCDLHGRFALQRRDPAAAAARMLFTAAGHAPVKRTMSWGLDGERVVLEVAGLVAIDVVDAATGAPIERFSAQLVDPSSGLRADPVLLAGRHPGGHLEARVAATSPVLLRVVAADERYAPSCFQLVTLDATTPQPIRCELCDWRDVDVLVLGSNGQPVAGASVEVLALPPDLSCTAHTPAVTDWRRMSSDRASTLFVARADRSARATVRTPSRGAFALRVAHDEAGTAIEHDLLARIDAAGSVRVVLTR